VAKYDLMDLAGEEVSERSPQEIGIASFGEDNPAVAQNTTGGKYDLFAAAEATAPEENDLMNENLSYLEALGGGAEVVGKMGLAMISAIPTATVFGVYDAVMGQGAFDKAFSAVSEGLTEDTNLFGFDLFKAQTNAGKKMEFVVGDWMDKFAQKADEATEFLYQQNLSKGMSKEHAAAMAATDRTLIEGLFMLPIFGVAKSKAKVTPVESRGINLLNHRIKVEPTKITDDYTKQFNITQFREKIKEAYPNLKNETVSKMWEHLQTITRRDKEILPKEILDKEAHKYDLSLVPKEYHDEFVRKMKEPDIKTTNRLKEDTYAHPIEPIVPGVKEAPYSPKPLPYGMFREVHNKNTKGKPVSETTVQKRYYDYITNWFPEIQRKRPTLTEQLDWENKTGKPFEDVFFDDALQRYIHIAEMEQVRKELKTKDILEAERQRFWKEAKLNKEGIEPPKPLGSFMGGKQRGAIGDLNNPNNMTPKNIAKGPASLKDVQRTNPELDKLLKTVPRQLQERPPKAEGPRVVESGTNAKYRIDASTHQPTGYAALEIAGGQALSAIRRYEDKSPTQRKLNDMLFRPELHKGTSTVEQSFHQARALQTGDWMKRLTDAYHEAIPDYFPEVRNALPDQLGGTWGKRIPKALNDEVRRVMVTGKKGNNVRANQLADRLRKLEDDFIAYANRVAPELGTEYLPNHLQRVWLWNKIKPMKFLGIKIKNRHEEFQALLEKHGFSSDDATNLINQIITDEGEFRWRVKNSGDIHRIANGELVSAKAPGLDYRRKLTMIPDEEIAPWVDTNVFSVLQKSLEEGVKRVEYTKMFGAYNEKLYKMISQIAKERNASGTPMSAWEIKRVLNLTEAIQGIYLSDVPKWWNTSQKVTITALNASLLQLATIASLPELALPLYYGGAKAFIKGGGQSLKHMTIGLGRQVHKDFMKMSKDDQTVMLELINKAGDAAAMERMHATFSGDMTYFNDAIFRLNGMYYWTRFMNQMSVNTYSHLMKQKFGAMIKDEGKMKTITKEEIDFLEHYVGKDGLNEGMQWARDGFPLEHKFKERLLNGALTFAEESVLSPNASITPMWHSNPYLKILSYLKAFPVTMGNQILKRWYWDVADELKKKHYMHGASQLSKVVGTGMSMIVLSYLGNQMSDWIRYGGDNPNFDEDFETKVLRALERSGLSGPANPIFDAIVHSYGQPPYIVAMGAVASKTDRMLQAIMSAVKERDARPLAREQAKIIAPIIFPFYGLRDDVQDNLADQLQDIYESWFDVWFESRGSGRARQERR
jgi:hypothetical protein